MSRKMRITNSATTGGSEADRSKDGSLKLEPGVQRALGHELRAMYDEVLSEPVPDRFLDLLRKLDDAEEQTKSETPKPD